MNKEQHDTNKFPPIHGDKMPTNVPLRIEEIVDKAVKAERNRIKEWVQTQVNDGGGQCIHYEEILEALQDNK